MQITINWRKTIEGATHIDTDNLDGFNAWWDDVLDQQPDAQMSGSWIQDFLENGDPDEWIQFIRKSDEIDGSGYHSLAEVIIQ